MPEATSMSPIWDQKANQPMFRSAVPICDQGRRMQGLSRVENQIRTPAAIKQISPKQTS